MRALWRRLRRLRPLPAYDFSRSNLVIDTATRTGQADVRDVDDPYPGEDWLQFVERMRLRRS